MTPKERMIEAARQRVTALEEGLADMGTADTSRALRGTMLTKLTEARADLARLTRDTSQPIGGSE